MITTSTVINDETTNNSNVMIAHGSSFLPEAVPLSSASKVPATPLQIDVPNDEIKDENNILSPSPSRGSWREDEDAKLRAAVQLYQGRNWKKIAVSFFIASSLCHNFLLLTSFDGF
jgi:hypothetical protein